MSPDLGEHGGTKLSRYWSPTLETYIHYNVLQHSIFAFDFLLLLYLQNLHI